MEEYDPSGDEVCESSEQVRQPCVGDLIFLPYSQTSPLTHDGAWGILFSVFRANVDGSGLWGRVFWHDGKVSTEHVNFLERHVL